MLYHHPSGRVFHHHPARRAGCCAFIRHHHPARGAGVPSMSCCSNGRFVGPGGEGYCSTIRLIGFGVARHHSSHQAPVVAHHLPRLSVALQHPAYWARLLCIAIRPYRVFPAANRLIRSRCCVPPRPKCRASPSCLSCRVVAHYCQVLVVAHHHPAWWLSIKWLILKVSNSLGVVITKT